MREVEKMTYAGRYPEKLRELMARWNLTEEFEAAKRVVKTFYLYKSKKICVVKER